MLYKNVIVKTPGQSYMNGLTTSDLGTPDYDVLQEQHAAYVQALKKCGVSVTHLPASEPFPDSTFVEDTAVLTPGFAVLTNPGAQSRNGEVKEIEPALRQFYSIFHTITSPGTLDGGDVLQIEDHFYIGLSDRTNEEGARQLKAILETAGYRGTIIPLKRFFHLKTGISYLGHNIIVAAGEFIDHSAFAQYDKITVAAEEEYAANCIRVNDYVMIPEGYEQTKRSVQEAGFETIELAMSEFRKHDGGLSCLSLRF